MLSHLGEAPFAVGTDVLEEQVAEGHGVGLLDFGCRERLCHPLLVNLVAALGGNLHLEHGDARGPRLCEQELAPDPVHADARVLVGDRRQERDRLDALLATQGPERERGILATAPRQDDTHAGLHYAMPS